MNGAPSAPPRSRGPACIPPPAAAHARRGTRATWFAYVLLLVLSIPWYFPAASGEPLVLGFPLWCFVALACYVLVAALTVCRIDSLWEAGRLHGSEMPGREGGEG